ncbi:N-methyl-L-tryptophan oxidase [Leekyejoonella antrihumi]|uniref:N-methyl-L-tryptophan oxidase n=1 Tax=Leekyejoonella antrihumi TaxID=1660198 RepID=A0A563DS21_9MICO|nr:N-methyl-L-tryptophan oxidase [Leekyejoonella antrihumi]TWP33025.1 N-methyl-L-tryptophan oxidase [Leekyejoonella antrihumi]
MDKNNFDADVAVVGLGAMGCMSLWRLSIRGISAIGFEQHTPGHPHGSSHGMSRLYRTACFEGADYTQLAILSKQLWQELEGVSSRELLELTGMLTIGSATADVVSGTLKSAQQLTLPHEVLDAAEIRSRFPQHLVSDSDIAVFDPDGGVLSPETALSAALEQSVENGAQVFTHAHVDGVSTTADGVVIRVGAEEFRVRHAIISAGPWIRQFYPIDQETVRVTRQVMTWFRARENKIESFLPSTFPAFIRDTGNGSGAWGCAMHGGMDVKIGREGFDGPVVDPDTVDRVIHTEDFDIVCNFARDYLPDLEPRPVAAQTCLMTLTPDSNFMIGPHPSEPNITILGGFSGHGFKHATGVGEVAAALAIGEPIAIPLARFAPSRLILNPSPK